VKRLFRVQLFVDHFRELINRKCATEKLAVHEKGRSGAHAEFFAISLVFLNGIRKFLRIKALFEFLLIRTCRLGKFNQVFCIEFILSCECEVVEFPELVFALLINAHRRF
jgi:hypothetical protein